MDVPSQIIGVDIAKEESKDYSSIASVCSRCNHILYVKTFQNSYEDNVVRFSKCPRCGVEFK